MAVGPDDPNFVILCGERSHLGETGQWDPGKRELKEEVSELANQPTVPHSGLTKVPR